MTPDEIARRIRQERGENMTIRELVDLLLKIEDQGAEVLIGDSRAVTNVVYTQDMKSGYKAVKLI